ncbi:MAG TPA: HesB/YadR/YfhF-family protein [Solirubrobacteraceae bacterium]|jgi:Fe-S cluster assembly iron-binding protein IscA|nr:HesB/YadR/YfhF-family protein [Solirubrobacteraceae bacterium]
MLAISPNASEAISRALEGAAIPDGAGLRLTTGAHSERGVAIEIAFVTAAAPGDEVIETSAPVDVFVEPVAARVLDDQVLDAQLQPDGALAFALSGQASSNGTAP